MKKYALSLLVILSLFGVSAMAKTILVVDESIGQVDVGNNAAFAYKKETGRAWVKASIYGFSDLYDKQYKVEGLSYDAASKEVRYTDALSGQSVVCQVKNDPTGKCALTVKTEKRPVDYYFDIVEENFLVIKMDVPL